MEIPKIYDPRKVEDKWYSFWEREGFFHGAVSKDKKPFSIVIPPPNVTGSLHMGHAFNNTLQDIIIRRMRMEGYTTLWMPGTDHAGIATQNVVERELREEGLDRRQLGREDFVERVWQWKEKYGNTIIEQLKRLGCSCDWERECFTMDEKCSLAVRTVFVKLFDEGLIYRDNYIVNWCPRCRTAISDIEVEHRETGGKLWYIKYRLKGSDDHVIIATTRPETMLGDTAVAINPDDPRAGDLVGRIAVLPLLERELPLIVDDYVDPEFGTGILKITPAHDPNDFEVGRRHGLAEVNIFNEDATVNENGGKYAGLDRYQAREAVLEDLEKQGLIEKVDDYLHAVGNCYRCGTAVEPYLSLQWFVRAAPLAQPAIEAVREGKTVFIPERWEKVYFDWMENIRDWCISRQLWWGHRIPAWYCDDCDEMVVAIEEPTSCPACGAGSLHQEEDVLDTWFSSALWPFSTMGWPEETPELDYFYPTSVLVTAHDIIFFWVARMMMMGIHFMGDIPFRDVLVTALIRDSEGKKMSKSSRNVIDPLDVLEVYGTDALRFTLAQMAIPGRDIFLGEDRIEGNRNFVNKIWNASRLALMNLEGLDPASMDLDGLRLELSDRWILSRMRITIEQVNANMDRYHFSGASNALHGFFWNEFCDWYLELVKPRLYQGEAEDKEAAQYVVWKVLECSLRLLHPTIPFVTEEIWQLLPGTGKSIMIASWPRKEEFPSDEVAEEQMGFVMRLITEIRTIRSEHDMLPRSKVGLRLAVADEEKARLIQEYWSYFENLAGAEELKLVEEGEEGEGLKVVVPGVEGFVLPPREVDRGEEVERMLRKLDKLKKDLERSQEKLSNPDFLNKAPSRVVNKEREKYGRLQEGHRLLEKQLDRLEGHGKA